MESVEKPLRNFLITISAEQQERCKRMMLFLQTSNDAVLTVWETWLEENIDDLNMENMAELQQFIGRMERISMELLEFVRKTAVQQESDAPSGLTTEVEEIAYMLNTFDPTELDLLKESMARIKKIKAV